MWNFIWSKKVIHAIFTVWQWILPFQCLVLDWVAEKLVPTLLPHQLFETFFTDKTHPIEKPLSQRFWWKRETQSLWTWRAISKFMSCPITWSSHAWTGVCLVLPRKLQIKLDRMYNQIHCIVTLGIVFSLIKRRQLFCRLLCGICLY